MRGIKEKHEPAPAFAGAGSVFSVFSRKEVVAKARTVTGI
jgi:hypothetical protein